MSTDDELDAIRQARGTCPICAKEYKSPTWQLHALRGHLMKEHTVDELVNQIAEEAILAALTEEEVPRFATGGVIEGPPTPITIDLSREQIITADEAQHWTAENSQFRRVILDRWVTSRRPLNAEEAREAEDAGLRVVEATAFEDDEAVFLPVEGDQEEDRKRPEQGRIVNGPTFQAALEEFRQKYERGELDELGRRHSPKS